MKVLSSLCKLQHKDSLTNDVNCLNIQFVEEARGGKLHVAKR